MIYKLDEIMSEHEYASPNEMAGYILHGGLDKNGNYISPRTLKRWEAVKSWKSNLLEQGYELIDGSTDLLKYGNYPNISQAKYLLNLSFGQFLWDSLTVTGVIEARGQALAEITAPDFQKIIVEDISETATGHMNSGLFKAHGFDEGGDPDSEKGAHDQMWFAARDLLFGKNAFPEPAIPESLARPQDSWEMLQIPNEYEGIISLLMNVLMIEIRAESFFSYTMELASSPDVFKNNRVNADLASEMISRIQKDEAIHVAYLTAIISELRAFTFKTHNNLEIKGSLFIDPVWKKMVAWHGKTNIEESKIISIKNFENLLQENQKSDTRVKEFHALAD
ncbi:MAG: hypothetical protein P8J93_07215 [SAR86 cluster bacterium]|nr:hypothetical protein [SAR86 cluster bacterium]